MCKFYSAIVTRNGDILHNQSLKSHEDISDMFNLNDNNPKCDNFVRVEFTTEKDDDSTDIEKYQLEVDKYATPEWFEQHREYVTSRLKDFVSKRIILTNKKILADGLYIVGKDVVINNLINATIVNLFGLVNNVNKGGVVENVYGGTVENVNFGGLVNNVNKGGTVNNVNKGGTVNNVNKGGGTVENVYKGGTVENVYKGSTVENVYNGGTVENVYNGGTVQQISPRGVIIETWDGGNVPLVHEGTIVCNHNKIKIEDIQQMIIKYI